MDQTGGPCGLGFCDYPGSQCLKEDKDHGEHILAEGRYLWHRDFLNQRLHLPLHKKVPWAISSWCTLTSSIQPWPLVHDTHLEKPNSILRPKCSFSLKTSTKFGRRWSCCCNVTGKKFCIWRGKKKCNSRDFSQVKKPYFYFKMSFCFSKLPAEFLLMNPGPKKPRKMSAWILSKARSLFQEGERCCSGSCNTGC